MNGYFRPLRRKCGVVSLVAACAFTGLWISCLRKPIQYVLHPKNTPQIDRLAARNTGRSWESFYSANADTLLIHDAVNDNLLMSCRLANESRVTTVISIRPETYQTRFGLLGFGYASYVNENYGRFRMISRRVTFPSIVVPLTLFSAYLLLSKLRNKPGLIRSRADNC